MNTKEVELRAIMHNGKIDSIISKLISLGAEDKGTGYIHDIYFCDKSCKTVEDAEMNKVGSYSIRIRREVKNEVERVTYNKKTIVTENDHNAWDEYEEDRDDVETAKQELLDQGYKFFFELEKSRHKFAYQNMEIDIEDIKDFGLGIEVEILTENGKEDEAKLKIKKFLKEILEITDNDIVPKSITNIIMHERAFKYLKNT